MNSRRIMALRVMIVILFSITALLASVSSLKANECFNFQKKTSETPFSGVVQWLMDVAENASDDNPMEDESTDDSEESEYALEDCMIEMPRALSLYWPLPYIADLNNWSAQNEPDYQPRPPRI